MSAIIIRKTRSRPLNFTLARRNPANVEITTRRSIPRKVIMTLFHKYKGIGNVFQTVIKFSKEIAFGINLVGIENRLSFGPFNVVDKVHTNGIIVKIATIVSII